MLGKYVVVEGPIGVGKQEVIDALAEHMDSNRVRDIQNPFLPSFYQNMDKYAFQTQVFFLLSRFQQQQEINQGDLFSSTVLCDYLFQKDRLFASLTLEAAEFALYEKIYGLLKGTVPTPDVVVYLQADVNFLMEKIAKKDNDLLLLLPKKYLESVVQAYQTFFFHYSLAPVIVCNVARNDYENVTENIQLLIKKINEVKSGLHYLNPEER